MYQIGEKRWRSLSGACLPGTNVACGGILDPRYKWVELVLIRPRRTNTL